MAARLEELHVGFCPCPNGSWTQSSCAPMIAESARHSDRRRTAPHDPPRQKSARSAGSGGKTAFDMRRLITSLGDMLPSRFHTAAAIPEATAADTDDPVNGP